MGLLCLGGHLDSPGRRCAPRRGVALLDKTLQVELASVEDGTRIHPSGKAAELSGQGCGVPTGRLCRFLFRRHHILLECRGGDLICGRRRRRIGQRPDGERRSRRLVERVGPQAEARRDIHGVKRQAHGRRRCRLPVREPQALDSAARAKTMKGDRALGLGAQLGPQNAANADRRALGSEGLFVAHIEAIAGTHVAAKVDRRGESLPCLEHHCRRHPGIRQRCVERIGDDTRGRDRAREGLASQEPRVLVVAAQQALLSDARVLARRIVCGEGRRHRAEKQRSGECRSKRCPMHEPPKMFPTDDERASSPKRGWARPR